MKPATPPPGRTRRPGRTLLADALAAHEAAQADAELRAALSPRAAEAARQAAEYRLAALAETATLRAHTAQRFQEATGIDVPADGWEPYQTSVSMVHHPVPEDGMTFFAWDNGSQFGVKFHADGPEAKPVPFQTLAELGRALKERQVQQDQQEADLR